MAALEDVVPLFRAQAFAHVEIMMLVWPQRDTPMWRDIREQQVVSGDLHRAAAEISTAYGERLRAAVLPTAEAVHVSIVDEDPVPAIRKAVVELRADIVFAVLGSVKPDSEIAKSVREMLSDNAVPLWVLHAPARTAEG
ncbi:MAG TPA: hypothetical protein VGP41_01465 [Candidatus Lustribacter sp.]|jgi:hypothetical protein|nr:hypothetical protein [Candidatus Lustribacter sp.]